MSEFDIVAELDWWLKVGHGGTQQREYRTLQRARDEIAATNVAIGRAAKEAYALGRAEALEAAVQLCERLKPLAEGKGQPGFTAAFQELIDTLVAAIRGLSG